MSYSDEDNDMEIKDTGKNVEMEDTFHGQAPFGNDKVDISENGRKRKRESSSDLEEGREQREKKKRKVMSETENPMLNDNTTINKHKIEMEDEHEEESFENNVDVKEEMFEKSDGNVSATSSEGELEMEFSSKNSEFILNIEVDKVKGKNLLVKIAPHLRLDTRFGKKQEDHVIAYRIMIDLIASSIRGGTLDDVHENLYGIASAIFPITENISFLFKELQKQRERFLPKKRGKEARNEIRMSELSPLAKVYSEGGKFAANFSRTTIIADCIKKIAVAIIAHINSLSDATFKKDRKGRSADRAQGSRIRNSVKALSGIDRLALGASNEKNIEIVIDEFFEKKQGREFYHKNGITNFLKKYNWAFIICHY